MSFKTDLNDRERKRYAEIFRGIAKSANETADAIESANDSHVLAAFLILTMRGSTINEFGAVLKTAAKNGRAEESAPEFPEALETQGV